MKNYKTLALTSLALAVAACSSAPPRNIGLDQAHQHYQAAQANPQVLKLAPQELQQAGDALGAADKALKDEAKTSEVDHLAYVANQKITVAMDTASARAAQQVSDGAAAERDKLRLDARTVEADQAKQQTEATRLQLAALEEQYKLLNAKKTERGMMVTLGDVLFDTGKADLLPGSASNMAKLAEFFKKNPQQTASIDGYTDNVGSDSYNAALSQRRAESVMSALVRLGVSASNLTVKGYGEASPTADNASAAGRQMNRRVEIVFAEPPTA
ncbi:OmpA family protein [Hydrocarboniphaga sp.]|uniref:OmpA family protein n=1 Tax=Hydrocarboniphaga sp. TaxID=2033016 RepID=UPI003D0DEEED